MEIEQIIGLLNGVRIPVQDEKETQLFIEDLLVENKIPFQREFKFDKNSIVDFFIDNRIAMEVKIKGSPRSTYKQCERYCSIKDVSELLLITNRSMGFPKEINGKPCYVLNMGKAWL